MTTMVRMVTPNTNITAGSINTTFLKDKSVTGDKIATTGALDNQVLSYDSATDTVIWQDVSYLDNTFENGIIVTNAQSVFFDDVRIDGDIDLNGDLAISGDIIDLNAITASNSFTLTVNNSGNLTLDPGGHVHADTNNFYVGSFSQAVNITPTSIGAVGTSPDVYATIVDASGASIFRSTVDFQSSTTGIDYGDLTNTPTIPTVPTNVSAFTNDAGYITSSGAVSAVESETTLELSEGLTVDSDIFVGDYDLLSTTGYSSTGVQVVKPDTKAKWAAVSVVEYGGDYNNTLPFGSFHNPTFGGEIHGGTQASPTAAPNGKRAVQFNGAARYGTGASDVHTIANIVIATNETQTSTNRGGQMQFRVTPNDDSSTRDFLKLSGQGSQRIDVDYDPSGHFSQTRVTTQSTDGFEVVGEVKFYDTIELDQKTAHPPNPSQGQMYFNTTDEKFYGYTGTTNGWVALN
jgi:hypothetical protein